MFLYINCYSLVFVSTFREMNSVFQNVSDSIFEFITHCDTETKVMREKIFYYYPTVCENVDMLYPDVLKTLKKNCITYFMPVWIHAPISVHVYEFKCFNFICYVLWWGYISRSSLNSSKTMFVQVFCPM